MDDNMMEHQIADYMVKHGTENTNYGTWVFEVDELAKSSILQRNGFRNMKTVLCLSCISEKK